ncbi:MAG: GH3 auxin-responsive promoter family protein [Bacteroidales bacterium]|nr:GH3 auxin-responsive promoter family protein [Bacteroidales bacterium]
MQIPIVGAMVKSVAEISNIPTEAKQKFTNPIRAQRRELRKLLRRAQFTEFGQQYGFSEILRERNITDAFRKRVPVFDYNKMHREWWYRNLKGERNVAWPGKIRLFALSSGTSEASSKFVPITRAMLNSITRAGTRQFFSTSQYDFPARFYDSGVLCIAGSTDLQYFPEGKYYAGDLSGISAGRIPKWFEFFYKPGQEISQLKDWNEKLDLMVKAAPTWDIGVLVGVPAWVQILLERIVKEYKLNNIHEMWPNLMVYVHSGVAFAPYEKSFERLFGKEVLYVESYLASEGYIAYQVDLKRRQMQLLVDNGVYFEFVPFDEKNFDDEGNLRPDCQTLTLSEVEAGRNYAILLSTCAGAWRYLIGDTVCFSDVKHCDMAVTGRTKQFLSLAGEHLSQDNMNRAVDMTAEELGIDICEFTVAGIRHDTMFAHHWYLGIDQPIDAQEALKRIDQHLCELNDDYRTERQEAIRQLYIDVLPTQLFYDFMRERLGKAGGASKFPRVLKGDRYKAWKEYIASKEERTKN